MLKRGEVVESLRRRLRRLEVLLSGTRLLPHGALAAIALALCVVGRHGVFCNCRAGLMARFVLRG